MHSIMQLKHNFHRSVQNTVSGFAGVVVIVGSWGGSYGYT